MDGAIWFIDVLARETMLFAAAGLLIGGIDDLLVDLCFFVCRFVYGTGSRLTLSAIAASPPDNRFAIFVAAWDESKVIEAMLSSALARLDYDNYRLYVGLYPNDRATIAAASLVASRDSRIRLAVGDRDGPTTKADNLNVLWRALLADEAADQRPFRAVILHDAEDLIHSAELRAFDALIDGRAVVQLPVLPLVKASSRLVSGHYADEFAEAHSRSLVARKALGAGMPLAGTGCAIDRDMLAAIAVERSGDPFDASSLTEDYELGLRIAELDGTSMFARIDDGNGDLIAVRAYFPATLPGAVRQKARWMTGIALAGWDRTGWDRPGRLGDHWMRMRDRRAPLAVLVLAVAYIAALAWGLRAVVHRLSGTPYPGDTLANWLLASTTMLLLWRLAIRVLCTARCYGWREARWSIPRFFVGNLVSLVAAPRALVTYLRLLRGDAPVWAKTAHEFPDLDASIDAGIAM